MFIIQYVMDKIQLWKLYRYFKTFFFTNVIKHSIWKWFLVQLSINVRCLAKWIINNVLPRLPQRRQVTNRKKKLNETDSRKSAVNLRNVWEEDYIQHIQHTFPEIAYFCVHFNQKEVVFWSNLCRKLSFFKKTFPHRSEAFPYMA